MHEVKNHTCCMIEPRKIIFYHSKRCVTLWQVLLTLVCACPWVLHFCSNNSFISFPVSFKSVFSSIELHYQTSNFAAWLWLALLTSDNHDDCGSAMPIPWLYSFRLMIDDEYISISCVCLHCIYYCFTRYNLLCVCLLCS